MVFSCPICISDCIFIGIVYHGEVEEEEHFCDACGEYYYQEAT
jgi:C4-type Zn-finger protein